MPETKRAVLLKALVRGCIYILWSLGVHSIVKTVEVGQNKRRD